MRAWLVVCAALALAPARPPAAATAAHAAHSAHAHGAHAAHSAYAAHAAHGAHAPRPLADRMRLEHIKSQILAKLGLSAPPVPRGAPPHSVARQILARAADPEAERRQEPEESMREIIAIAERDEHDSCVACFQSALMEIS